MRWVPLIFLLPILYIVVIWHAGESLLKTEGLLKSHELLKCPNLELAFSDDSIDNGSLKGFIPFRGYVAGYPKSVDEQNLR